jgi:hypothetical protein
VGTLHLRGGGQAANELKWHKRDTRPRVWRVSLLRQSLDNVHPTVDDPVAFDDLNRVVHRVKKMIESYENGLK